MRRNTLLILLIGLRLSTLFAGDIPAYRKYQWYKSGASDRYYGNLPTVSIGQFNGDASGTHSNNEAFNEALAALGETGGTIQFIGGTYLFTQPVHIPSNVIIKGNGASTELIFDLEQEGHAIQFTGRERDQEISLAKNALRGDSTLQLHEGHGLKAGDYLKITLIDSKLAYSDWAKNHIGQIVQIVAVDGNIAKLYSPIRIRLPEGQSRVRALEPVEYSGIQCLVLTRKDRTDALTSNIRFQNATNCFVRNISSNYGNFAHVEISMSSQITVEGSRFQKAHAYGSGGQGYGVVLQYSSGDNLIQNNVFETLRHSILLQAGANGNVVSYNFSTFPNWDQPGLPSNAAGDIVLHGNYPFANLFEGNVAQNIVADNSHGKNGYHNTFYRNEVDLYGLFADFNAIDSMNIVGNSINNQAFLHGIYRLSGLGHFENHNVVKGNVKPSNSTQLQENSLYLEQISAFANNAPGKTEVYRIEAETRYHEKSPLLCRAPVKGDEKGNDDEKEEETKDSTGTSVHTVSSESWSIYPNPAHDNITITGASYTRISLSQLNGSTVLRAEGTTTLSVGHLPRGLYLLQLVDNNGRSTYKKLLLN